MTLEENQSSSPRWSWTAKVVVALTIAGVALAILFRFKNFVAPLMLAFVLAYLIYPLASFFHRKLKIPWRAISTILYLLLFLLVIGLLVWGGFSIFEQGHNLINYLQGIIGDLPAWFDSITSKPLVIGNWSWDLSKYQLSDLTTQFQGVISPLLTNLGGVLGSIASGVGSTVTWTVFILLISYFIMSESAGVRAGLLKLSLPTYEQDLQRMGQQLSQIWNAFLRGQLIVFLITVVWYSILLSVLGVRYFFLLALLAGLARFVPYVGPFIAWTTYGLVALFQTNYFNLLPFPYALIVVGFAWVSDLVIDNFVSPRVMSNALKVHPAAVLVMVLVSGSLFGFIGIILSAPVLASLKLILTYVTRKLLDVDPWQGMETYPPPPSIPESFSAFWRKLFKNREKTRGKEVQANESSLDDEETKKE
jgi:predicted PurR-regulated permease PerM